MIKKSVKSCAIRIKLGSDWVEGTTTCPVQELLHQISSLPKFENVSQEIYESGSSEGAVIVINNIPDNRGVSTYLEMICLVEKFANQKKLTIPDTLSFLVKYLYSIKILGKKIVIGTREVTDYTWAY